MKTLDAARGKWRGILLQLDIDESFLRNRHGPCPLCGGTDRYRWDNKDGNGSYLCSQCGAGTGMQLLQKLKGWDFGTAAREVDKVLGNVSKDPPSKPALAPERRKELLREVWKGSRPLSQGDAAHAYLTGARRLSLAGFDVSDLRFHPKLRRPDNLGGGEYPALLALVRDHAGNPVSLHRTFLGESGHVGRAMMAGDLPDSIAVRLGAPINGKLAIAEGLETALAVSRVFGVACWSTVNAGYLAKFVPPEGVERVVIYGDSDESFTGQAAAYACARRLVGMGYSVAVELPSVVGMDWADGT
jgi:putative DNA primase/helicase